jgi:hypothetical protein
MSDEIARQLERSILGNAIVVPCGCVLRVNTRFPGTGWVRSGGTRTPCRVHAAGAQLVEGWWDSEGYNLYDFTGLPAGHDLGYKWLTQEGVVVAKEEIAAAFDALLVKHTKIVMGPDGISTRAPENAYILCEGYKYAVNRDGGLDYAPTAADGLSPGDLVEKPMNYPNLWSLFPMKGV